MEEEVQLYLEDTSENMEKTIKHYERELTKLRAGKANPQMLDGIMVDYYGTLTPLKQVANVGITDPRTLAIQPWEKTMIEPIEKAIMKANIGLHPNNNGEIIRINVPALTEERRKQLVKQVKTEGENSKITLRKMRRETIDELKKLKKDGLSEDMQKDAEDEVQKIIDSFIKKVDQLMEKKEQDIMTI